MQLKNPFERLNLVLWQPLAGYATGLILVLCLLGYRLASLVPGFSIAEKHSINASRSLKVIFDNPLFGSHNFLQYLGLKINHHSFVAMRLPSVMFAVAAVLLFFYIVNRWFNFRIAVITTVLLATSSWFLHLARIATSEIGLLGLLAPLAYAVWLPRSKRPIPALIIGATIVIYMVYTPGLIWFLLAGLYWQRHSLVKTYREARIPSLLILSACAIVSVPLIMALINHRDVLMSFLGLPRNFNHLTDVPRNLLAIPYRLLIAGPNTPENNLARLPLLDFFTAVMAIIGAYSYINHSKLRRSRLLLACLILASLLVALNGSITIAILLPFIYLLTAGGINFMVEQWLVVFPYNPLARSLATVLLVAGVITTSYYHLNRYFIAWPQAPATKQAYSQKP